MYVILASVSRKSTFMNLSKNINKNMSDSLESILFNDS
jgi:hypothetical protein